jgi:hypothetical protein
MKTYFDARHETHHEGDVEAYNATKLLEETLQATVVELAKMGSFKRQRDIM